MGPAGEAQARQDDAPHHTSHVSSLPYTKRAAIATEHYTLGALVQSITWGACFQDVCLLHDIN